MKSISGQLLVAENISFDRFTCTHSIQNIKNNGEVLNVPCVSIIHILVKALFANDNPEIELEIRIYNPDNEVVYYHQTPPLQNLRKEGYTPGIDFAFECRLLVNKIGNHFIRLYAGEQLLHEYPYYISIK